MKQGNTGKMLAALVLTLLYSTARAIPTEDPLSDPFAGVTFDFNAFAIIPPTETLHYDAAAQRLSYSAAGAFELFFRESRQAFLGLRDIGFFKSGFDEEFGFSYASFRGIFDNSFLNPSVADFGPRMGFFLELAITNLSAPIFSGNFHCSLAAPRSCPGNGDYFSTSGLTTIAVPEPPMAAGLAVALIALGLGVRPRKRLPTISR